MVKCELRNRIFPEIYENMSAAREWSQGKTVGQIWDECKRADWMVYLLLQMIGQPGWPDARIVWHVLGDCISGALPYFDRKYPEDKKPHKAIQALHDFADGKITSQKLVEAINVADVSAKIAYVDSYYEERYDIDRIESAPSTLAARAIARAATFAAHAATVVNASDAAIYAAYAIAATAYAAHAADVIPHAAALKSMADYIRMKIFLTNGGFAWIKKINEVYKNEH